MEKVAGEVTTAFAYDGEDILRRAAGGTTTFFVHGPGIDEPLASEQSGVLTYLHADGLGSIVATSDQAGERISNIEYDAWGNIKSGTPDGYAFTGREWDPEIGLYYYRARYYDPKIGRFISEDPIGVGGGDINFYRYVLDNPSTWVDPGGLEIQPPGGWWGHQIEPTPSEIQQERCFWKGMKNGAIGAGVVTLGAAAAAYVGVPVAAITTVLGVAGALGGGYAIGDLATKVISGDGNGAAYTIGSITGGALVGAATVKAVPGVNPNAPWTPSGGKGYDPNLEGTVWQWLGTGPDKASGTGAAAAIASGASVAGKDPCGCQ